MVNKAVRILRRICLEGICENGRGMKLLFAAIFNINLGGFQEGRNSEKYGKYRTNEVLALTLFAKTFS